MFNSRFNHFDCLWSMICRASSRECCACCLCKFRNIEIVVDISIRSGCSLFAVRCCRGILPACHTVNVIVEYHNGKVDISSACVNQMVPADCGSISVTCDDDYRKFRVCKLNACCESDCSAVRGMQRVVVHISCSS